MKATLEFDCPDEEQQLQLAIDGYKWKAVVEEVDTSLRNMAKYDGINTVSTDYIRKIITEAVESWGLEQ